MLPEVSFVSVTHTQDESFASYVAVFIALVCSNHLKSKVAAFLICFKIHHFHINHFQLHFQQYLLTRNKIPLSMGILTEVGNVSYLHSSFFG